MRQISFCAAAYYLAAPQIQAAILERPGDGYGGWYGESTAASGSMGIVGKYRIGFNREVVSLYRNLDTAAGTITENARLASSAGTTYDQFGDSVSLSGSIGIVGAPDAPGFPSDPVPAGAAYVFRNLDTASGTLTENAKLVASDSEPNNFFGYSTSISGTTGLVGATAFWIDTSPASSIGRAYVFRNLDTATGTITENAKLMASVGETYDQFGFSVSMSGTNGLIGAPGDDSAQGCAYLFRNLNTAIGSITENVKLVASDGLSSDYFGWSVNLDGTNALVVSMLDTVTVARQGSAYFFRNLDTATGTITENVKLTVSDATTNSPAPGVVSSLSGNNALIGACFTDAQRGAVYLFRNLDTATGAINENVKITSSTHLEGEFFGWSVSLDGDNFLIGQSGAVNNAYSGSVSSITTLDDGAASRVIDGISFTSKDDWIIGKTTDENTVLLSDGDNANVTVSGKAVFIGKEAGSNDNMLAIAGTITANEIRVGSLDGNSGNTLSLESTATFTINSILLAPDNLLAIEGDYNNISNLLSYLGGTQLKVWDGSWVAVTVPNYSDYLNVSFDGFITSVEAIPEPGTVALAVLGLSVFLLCGKRFTS